MAQSVAADVIALIMHVLMQVLDFAAFSEPEYDLPIFCANAFSSPARSIVVL